jgi:cytochrome P450
MRIFSRLFKASRAGSVANLQDGLDLLDPVFVDNPYPTYAALRERGGLHRCRSGAWIATRYEDVLMGLGSAVLGNRPSRYSAVHARNQGRYISASVAANILPYQDRPEHVVPRRIVGTAFRARLQQMKLDVGATARQLLYNRRDGSSFDVMADFATPLSSQVICALMGLPDADLPQLATWSQAFFRLFAPFPSEEIRVQTDAALAEFRQYFMDISRSRRAAPGDDFVSRLLVQEENARRLTDVEVADNCMLVFADGLENIDAALANLVLALDQYPHVVTKLRGEPQYRVGTVQEGLRYDSPAQLIARVAQTDGEFAGQAIKRDSVVFLALGSANRDEKIFANANTFDPSRLQQALVSFGKGRHSCLGAALVTVELVAALDALLEASSEIVVERQAVRWMARVGHRWPTAVPIRLLPT